MQRIIRESWLATLMIVIVTVGMATSTDGRGNATETTSTLLQKLLTSYDNKVPPAELTGETTAVDIGIYILRNPVDFKARTVSTVLYFRQSWIDKRLQFDKSNVTRKMLSLHDGDCDKVWLPDTFIREVLEPPRVDHRLLKIDPSGKTWYVQRMFITVGAYESEGFPYTIPFTFESFAHTADSIILRPMSNALELAPDSEFSYQVRSTSTLDCTTAYTSGTYTCLSMRLLVVRRSIAYARKQLCILAPVTLLVAVLSSTASWLSPSSNGGLVSRILIGVVTSVLSFILIVMKDGYTDQFGNSSASDVLIIGCVLVVVVAFLESVTVIVLASTKSTETKKQDDSETTQCKGSEKLRRIDFVAKILIPSVFVVFGIAFLIVLFQ